MLDNPLINLVISIIRQGLDANGLTAVEIKQNYQPTQQGVELAPTIYLFKLSDDQYGFLGRTNSTILGQEDMEHVESQVITTDFQVSTLAIQNPENINSVTASDLANTTALILKSDAALRAFKAQKVGLFRIQKIINPQFEDDRARNEALPSFDFTLSHKRDMISTIPKISKVETGLFRI